MICPSILHTSPGLLLARVYTSGHGADLQTASREIARNIEIVGADPVTMHGFTMVPNVVLTKPELSVGAKLAYAMVLKYAWQDNYCFPGQSAGGGYGGKGAQRPDLSQRA